MKNKVKLFFGVIFSLLASVIFSFPSMATELNFVDENSYNLDRVRVVVESYEVEEYGLLPGSETQLKLTVKNISDKLTAQNTVVSVVNNQGIIFPVEGMSNQTVIGDIEANSTCEITIPLRVSENVGNNDEVTLIFYFNFMDVASHEVTNETYISIPLKGECELAIVDLNLSDNCYMGSDAILSGTVENTGTVMANNVMLHIFADGAEEVVYNLGDIGGGITTLYNHAIRMVTAGEQVLTAYLTYEDDEGKLLSSETMEYNVRVLERESSLEGPQATGSNLNQMTFVVNGALVLVALFIMFVFRRRDARRITSGKEIGYGKRS